MGFSIHAPFGFSDFFSLRASSGGVGRGSTGSSGRRDGDLKSSTSFFLLLRLPFSFPFPHTQPFSFSSVCGSLTFVCVLRKGGRGKEGPLKEEVVEKGR